MNARHQPGGNAYASRTGDTSALLGVRPYRPGDPIRDLHARSWARHRVPVVREYQAEHFSRIGLVVDNDVKAATPPHLEAALSLAAGVIDQLRKGDVLVDLMVVGDQVHVLNLGRNQGAMDQALDVLAAVQQGVAFSANRSLTTLGPHLESLSCVIFIALAWDDVRAGLASAIRSRGTACLALVVSDGSARLADATAVGLEAIVKGEALSL